MECNVGICVPTQRFQLPQVRLHNLVRTSQETYYVSARKPSLLMLFGETVAVYCENHREHINTLCGQREREREKWQSSERHYI
jgi:hypothetical protein